MTQLLCCGLGYSAAAVAGRLRAEGWRVTGTSRSREGAARLATQGFAGLVFDGQAPSAEVTAALATTTHALVTAPPDALGDPLLRLHGADLARAAHLGWIAYLSTVGVYGEHGGGWVDEATAPKPGSTRSRQRYLAETQWQELAAQTGRRLFVLRLAGIYGPGRNALETLRAGTARRIIKPGQVFNRIHVADIASACLTMMAPASAPGVYNVTDDEPAPPQDVIAFAAGLLGLPVPPDQPFDTAELTPMARSFYAENKRVANRKLGAALAVRLAFPTYREGLMALRTETGREV